MLRWIKHRLDLFRLRIEASEPTTLLIIAAGVGILTGMLVFLYRVGIEWFHELMQERLAHDVLGGVLGIFAPVAALGIAGVMVGLWTDRFVGHERHHGVAGVIEAVALSGGRLPVGKAPFKAIASAFSLGAGASVGPEDPSVQIGANLGSLVGRLLRLPEEPVKLMVAAGAASAIAAAFKAPIAGVFFALEVVMNSSFSVSSISFIILASVSASALTQAIEPGFEMGPFTYTFGGPLEIALFIPLGAILAIVSVLFMRGIYWQYDLWHKYVKLPNPLRTGLAGVMVGLVGIFLPQILGVGREAMNGVLGGYASPDITVLLILVVAKIVMTQVSLAGGFLGGVFAPALFAGTMLGAAYGTIVEALLQGPASGPPAYAIAGMAGMLCGVLRAPITAILLVFELTNDYRMILPMMLTTVVCTAVAERFEKHGIYGKGLERAGLRLQTGRDIDMMQGVLVEEAMVQPAPIIAHNATLPELRAALRNQHSNSLCVLDDHQQLIAVVTLSDLQRAFETGSTESMTVSDIASHQLAITYPDEPLWSAIRTMSIRDVGRLPVVERGTRRVVGFIGRHGVVRAYNIALSRKVQDQHTAERVRLNNLTGGHVYELRVRSGSPVAGSLIRDVKWPVESVVASIQRSDKLIVPHGDSDIRVGDILMIVADPSVAVDLQRLTGQVLGSHR